MTPSKLYYPLDVLPRLSYYFILIGINPRFAKMLFLRRRVINRKILVVLLEIIWLKIMF